jgi:hypothetical protein
MTTPYLFQEPATAEVTCLVGIADRHGHGRCQDRKCGKRSTTLLNGLCIDCTTKRNLGPAAEVCPPIRLTASAATGN